ncbi:hypothetical protein VE04_05202 [Pseudogymnoascus sp. 24MN13]|nr:hypothetical protein VE04_05202 [Pseudogymnoascus sp. 24MN13]
MSAPEHPSSRWRCYALTLPPWMQPVQLLLEQNCVGEAERLFIQDLGSAQDYSRRRARMGECMVGAVWGLYECLECEEDVREALFIQASRDIALASADVLASGRFVLFVGYLR